MRWAFVLFGIVLLLAGACLIAALTDQRTRSIESPELEPQVTSTEESPWETWVCKVYITFVFIPFSILFLYRPEFVFSTLGVFIAFCFLLSRENKRFHLRFSLQRFFISSLILSTTVGYTIHVWNADLKDIWGR